MNTLESEDAAGVETGRWLLSIAKHLDGYAASHPQLAYLFATRRSARDGALLLRIRGLNLISRTKLEALALDVGISRQELPEVLTRIEALTGIISIQGSSRDFTAVSETILTEQEVFRAINTIFEVSEPSQVERAIIPLLDIMSRLPLPEDDVVARVCSLGFDEVDVRKALELQESFGLLNRRLIPDLGTTLLYNEYLWGEKIERIGPILAGMRRRETDYLLSLMDEVRSLQGQSLNNLSAAPSNIIDMAAHLGIIDTTTIVTAQGDQKTFVFSPHFYGYRAGPGPLLIEDTADQVKLFLASMTYGSLYSADFKLHSPQRFVETLYHQGEAGLATPILRDYILLERQGIVKVEERMTGRGRFILQKPDVVERALRVMRSGSLLTDSEGINDVRGLVSQRSAKSPEINRLVGGFGKTAEENRSFTDELMTSIRETAQRGVW